MLCHRFRWGLASGQASRLFVSKRRACMSALKSAGTTPTRRDLLKLTALGAGVVGGGVSLAAPAAAAPSDVPPMRSRPEMAADVEPMTMPTLAGLVLNRAGFGPWPGDIQAFNLA